MRRTVLSSTRGLIPAERDLSQPPSQPPSTAGDGASPPRPAAQPHLDEWKDGARLRAASEPLLSQPAAGSRVFGVFLRVSASRLSLLPRSYSGARARTQTTASPHWPAPELETDRSQWERAVAACAPLPNTEHFVSEEGNAHIHIAAFDSSLFVFYAVTQGKLWQSGAGENSGHTPAVVQRYAYRDTCVMITITNKQKRNEHNFTYFNVLTLIENKKWTSGCAEPLLRFGE